MVAAKDLPSELSRQVPAWSTRTGPPTVGGSRSTSDRTTPTHLTPGPSSRCIPPVAACAPTEHRHRTCAYYKAVWSPVGSVCSWGARHQVGQEQLCTSTADGGRVRVVDYTTNANWPAWGSTPRSYAHKSTACFKAVTLGELRSDLPARGSRGPPLTAPPHTCASLSVRLQPRSKLDAGRGDTPTLRQATQGRRRVLLGAVMPAPTCATGGRSVAAAAQETMGASHQRVS